MYPTCKHCGVRITEWSETRTGWTHVATEWAGFECQNGAGVAMPVPLPSRELLIKSVTGKTIRITKRDGKVLVQEKVMPVAGPHSQIVAGTLYFDVEANKTYRFDGTRWVDSLGQPQQPPSILTESTKQDMVFGEKVFIDNTLRDNQLAASPDGIYMNRQTRDDLAKQLEAKTLSDAKFRTLMDAAKKCQRERFTSVKPLAPGVLEEISRLHKPLGGR